MQKFFSDSDPAELETPVIGKAAELIQHTSQKRKGPFQRDAFENYDITIIR